MPSGYTNGVYEGTGATLKDYLFKVAEDYVGKTLLYDNKVSPETEDTIAYYRKEVADAEDRLAYLLSLDLAKIEELYASYIADDDAFEQRYEADVDLRAERYKRVEKELLAWVPPSDKFAPLKQNALSHLREGYEFDCGSHYRMRDLDKARGRPWRRRYATAVEYHDAEVLRCRDTINDYTEKLRRIGMQIEDARLYAHELRESFKASE